jgi:superfamily I DNA and/or RNA helicase
MELHRMPLLCLENLPRHTTKGELLGLLNSVSGLGRARVGRIELQGNTASIEVPVDWGDRLVRALDGAAFKDRRLAVHVRGGEAASLEAGEHFQMLGRLLDLESQAEEREVLQRLRDLPAAEAESRGECLCGLVVAEESSGLGGRCILTLAKRNRTLVLPWNRLEPGAPVILAAEETKGSDGWRAVVCERGERFVSVALNEPPDETAGTYRVSLTADEVSLNRQRAAMDRARSATRDRLAALRNVLLGAAAPTFGPEAPFEPLDPTLNEVQREAVRFALSARDVAILHGPPGTGKTTAVVELIRQAVRRGERVLACAPSNLAVDNLLERLLAAGEQAVRLGHPARVLPALREHTLDLLAADHPDTRQARKWAKEAFALFRQASKWTRARPEAGARQQMRQEARQLLADARRQEAQAIEQIINGASIVCATLTVPDAELLGRRSFDLAVIDEAGQSTEPACWLPLLRCERVVLAGDHCQLPPTVVARDAAAGGLSVSLMERLVAHYGPTITRRLEVQYRMHASIMAYSSAQFYEGALEADAAVAAHRLCDLPGVTANALTETPVQFIDTAGASYDEQPEPGGESRLNPREAEMACAKVRALLDAGVPEGAIAVIAPYAAQVRRLRELLGVPGVEIDSVDGFQGREKEAVIISLVRSNPTGEVGFLADVRRTNVALTRARRKLLVIGDSATLSAHPFYRGLFEYFESIGAYHSVWEDA